MWRRERFPSRHKGLFQVFAQVVGRREMETVCYDLAVAADKYGVRYARDFEHLREPVPFVNGEIYMLPFDRLLFHPLLGQLARGCLLLADVKEPYRLAAQLFDDLTLGNHASTAWAAVHSPEVEVEQVAGVWFDDALQNLLRRRWRGFLLELFCRGALSLPCGLPLGD